LKQGCELGWLVDPGDRSILVFLPQHQPELRHGNDALTILNGLELQLTTEQVFSWLKME